MAYFRVLVVAAALLLAMPGDAWASSAARCVLKLEPEIDCPSCEDGIKHVLVSARGVQSAEIDVIENRIAVMYDPAKINVKALIGRIRVMGYTASEVKK